MKDIQSQIDFRQVNIRKVGVKTISYPITLLDRDRNRQTTIATVNMYVNLPHQFKGTHMSRFVEILNMYHGEIDLRNIRLLLDEMKKRLDAEASHIELTFRYSVAADSAVDGLKTKMYACQLHASLEQAEDQTFAFDVPLSSTSVGKGTPLPARSGSRWGLARVAVRFRNFVWLEDLIGSVGNAAAEGFAVSSAGDRTTEHLLCRQISVGLEALASLKWYAVTVEKYGDGYSTYAFTESSCGKVLS